MGNNEDGFDVQTSDQTASSPTSEQTPPILHRLIVSMIQGRRDWPATPRTGI